MRLFSTIAATAVILSGCMTYHPPTLTAPERAIVVDKPFDTTWELVIDWYAAQGVGIDKIQKESGLISAIPGTVGIGSFVSCGKLEGGAFENYHSAMSTVVRKVSDYQSKITVNVSANAKAILRNGYGQVLKEQEVECISTGKLEKTLQAYVSENK